MRIELRIDRIVLHGVALDGAGAAALREAVANELTKILGDSGPWRQRRLRELAAEPVRLAAPLRPEVAGRAVARSLHAGISGAAQGRRSR